MRFEGFIWDLQELHELSRKGDVALASLRKAVDRHDRKKRMLAKCGQIFRFFTRFPSFR